MPNHSELLKQMALEVVDGIPLDVFKIYNDGSKGETNTTGSGVLIELPGRIIKFQRRNAGHASFFRTELIAIISSPYPSTVSPFSCRPAWERSNGGPCEGGYQRSCGSGRPHAPYVD
ncbi:hypothetical protein TNCV_3556511 [Trichonephila clavipes]|uniref:Uncharacterized protein n=1 Tax=Trichonephila clavipes TaxID=2585209 RepID=A0A8X6WC23_TRICX|nr:hypothetical protein TNCV_3556511 [Trichonephila clavipes]